MLKKNPPSLYTKEFSWPRFASRQEKRLSLRFCFTSFTFPGSPVRRGETTSFTTHRLFLSSFSLLPSPLLPPLYLLHTNSPSPSTFSLALCLLYPSSSSSSSSTGESYLLLLEAFCKEDVFLRVFLCGECTLACSSSAPLRRHRHANVWPCFRPLHYQQRVHRALVLRRWLRSAC